MDNKRLRLIHFERYNSDGGCGFYCGYHNLTNFSEEEILEFYECQFELFGPYMPFYRDFEFFFTRYGFKKHKRLIHFLIKATSTNYSVRCYRIWSNSRDIAYQDKEQIALYTEKKCVTKLRKRMIARARRVSG